MREKRSMRAWFPLLLLLMTWLVPCQAQPHFLPDDSSCKDTFPWCHSQAHACAEVDALRALCRKTCDNCPSTKEACEDAGCTQECTVSEDGSSAKCGCFKGYELEKDGRNCKDIDECAADANTCAEAEDPICVNTPGSYTCTTCRALDGLSNYYQSTKCCKRHAKSFSQCGSSSTNGRVTLGGTPARVGRWPWMAYIQIGEIICGGSLMHRRWILTSADCIRGHSLRSIRITMGALNTTGEVINLHEQYFRVHKAFVHPNFNFPYNDIALLRLRSPAVMGSSVGTICLPNGHHPQVGETCFATGYGALRYGGRPAGHLQEVDLPIVDNEVCKRTYDNDSITFNSTIHMCAGHLTGGKDTCQGDSGGPLVCQRCNNCDWYVAGITSFGKGCAVPGQYGVYTRVEHFEEWIAKKIALRVRKRTCVRPRWHDWGGWTDCTASCGGGRRSRTRFCIDGKQGVPDCLGDLYQTEDCNTIECSNGSVVGSWGAWTDGLCSTTCGEGTVRSTRECEGASIGEPGCKIGDDTRIRSCSIRLCPKWESYEPWSDCSATCGGGTRRATRTCNTYGATKGTCEGSATKTERCQPQRCPRWTTYTRWSTCTATCGGGIQRRRRLCLNGNVGDIGCHIGNANEIIDCNTVTCERWGDFGPYGPCTATCGSGVQTATRKCIGGEPGDQGCQGPTTRSQTCNHGLCEEWTEWEPCPVTCGGGKEVRHRGDEREERDCNINICPEWSPYEAWSECSLSCGGGTRSSTRTCITYGAEGASCEGESTRYENCQEQTCPAWTSWGKYRGCSRSCGGGAQSRRRSCRNGEVGQMGCEGEAVATRNCNEEPCPYWGLYGGFNACSVTCGGGTQIAQRRCINGEIGQNGCRGPYVRARTCNTDLCPVWEEFGPYGKCSASCDGGTQTSTRSCRNGRIGQPACVGNHTRSQPCNLHACPRWGEFGNYSRCSVSCGGGVQTKTRDCIGGDVGEGYCVGDATQEMACNNQTCHVPLCCDRTNKLDNGMCLGFVRQGYCVTFPEYMEDNCRRACCQFANNLICSDGFSDCPLYKGLCYNLNVRQRCPFTCELCTPQAACSFD